MYAAINMCGTSYQVAGLKMTADGVDRDDLARRAEHEARRLVHPAVRRDH